MKYLRTTKMNPIYIFSASLICALMVGGCDTVRDTFGLNHYRPQEWDATPNEGLILPPDFHHRPKLPQPQPGAPSPHAVPETVKAQKTVLGDDSPADTSVSTKKGEEDVIVKASEQQTVTPNIREVVDEEAKKEESLSEKVITKIKDWKKEAAENLTGTKPKNSQEKEAHSTEPHPSIQREEETSK